MRHSALTRRLDVESARVWDIHYLARERSEAGEDVILLTVGDPDFDTPPAIVDEAERSLRRGRTRYGPTAGDPPLLEAIARHHEKTTGQPVGADNVVVFAGAQKRAFRQRAVPRRSRRRDRRVRAAIRDLRRRGRHPGGGAGRTSRSRLPRAFASIRTRSGAR